MEKIIFLDIDGVLNSYKYWDSDEFQEYHKLVETSENYKEVISQTKEIDPDAVSLLTKIIKQTNAKIVISSTWRSRMSEVYEALGRRGFNTSVIIGRTTTDGCVNCYRGNQIHHWLKNNEKVYEKDYTEFKNYVILDDDSDMLYWQKDNFIQTDTKLGLTEQNVKDCIRILNKE